MPLALGAGSWITLRWWWEPPPAGEPVVRLDPIAARHHVARLRARPEILPELRRFLRAGAPWLAAPFEDGELVDRLAAALAAGRVELMETRGGRLVGLDGEREEEAPVRPAARSAPEPAAPREEICWPCQERAAASAGALRE